MSAVGFEVDLPTVGEEAEVFVRRHLPRRASALTDAQHEGIRPVPGAR